MTRMSARAAKKLAAEVRDLQRVESPAWNAALTARALVEMNLPEMQAYKKVSEKHRTQENALEKAVASDLYLAVKREMNRVRKKYGFKYDDGAWRTAMTNVRQILRQEANDD